MRRLTGVSRGRNYAEVCDAKMGLESSIFKHPFVFLSLLSELDSQMMSKVSRDSCGMEKMALGGSMGSFAVS